MEPSSDERLQIPLAVITEALDGYERGAVSLARAVADVGGAIDALSALADEAWVAELRTVWSGLEIVDALDTPPLTEPARRDVDESIAELRAVLAHPPPAG